MNKYQTRDHEAGNVIDEFTTLEEAINACHTYVDEDKKLGEYTPNFYEVYNIETEEVEYIA
jgi:hypothetical protein